MENIVMLSPAAILHLAEAATRADNEGRTLRICTGDTRGVPWIKYKVGEGMWTAPFYCTGVRERDDEEKV